MAHLEVKPKSRSYWWLWLLIVIAIVVIALYFLKGFPGKNTTVTTTDSSKTTIDSTSGKTATQR